MNSAELSLPKTRTDYDAYFNPGLTPNRTERGEDTASLTSFGAAAQVVVPFFFFKLKLHTSVLTPSYIFITLYSIRPKIQYFCF